MSPHAPGSAVAEHWCPLSMKGACMYGDDPSHPIRTSKTAPTFFELCMSLLILVVCCLGGPLILVALFWAVIVQWYHGF